MYHNTKFPTNQFLVQPIHIDVNRPPVRYDVQCANWIRPYLDFMTGVAIDVITKEAQGPVSIHFYNNMSQNNWNNAELAKELANMADYIFLKAGGQQDPNLIGRLVPQYLDLRTKYEVALYPELGQFINPQDGRMFDDAIRLFDQEINAIAMLRQGGNNRAPMPQSYQPPVASAPYQAPAPAGGGYSYNQGQTQSRPSTAGRDYGTASQPPAAQPQSYVPPQTTGGQQVAPAPQAQQTSAPPGAATVGVFMATDEVKWNPAPEAPHGMLYNPVAIEMMYKIVDGHTFLQPTPSKMDPINYDRHSISTLFGRVPENLPVVKDNTGIASEIKNDALEAVEESQQVDSEGMRKAEHYGLRNIMTAFSLDEAILVMRSEMMSKVDRGHPPKVFQGYAQIFTPIMGQEEDYELVHKFANCSSYVALREELNAAGSTASPALLTDIQLKLTKLMNEILRSRLSIQRLPGSDVDLVVDDFSSDLDELFNILKTGFGGTDRIYKAFIKDQASRIRAMFDAPDLETEAGRAIHDDLTSNVLTGVWDGRDDAPHFTFYGPTVCITFLDVISHDLILAGMPGIGNVITKAHSAILYDLAKSLFQVEHDGLLVDRQLVVTKDGRVMEIYQGAVIEGTYLMNIVK